MDVVLSFEENAHPTKHTGYSFMAEEKYYIVMIDERNFFDKPVKNNLEMITHLAVYYINIISKEIIRKY